MILKSIFKYLGELFIVVIGISIAFQLNVWNDSRKNRQLEKDLLQSFMIENQLNQEEIDSSLIRVQQAIESNLKLIEVLKSKKPNRDSIRLQLSILYQISWPELTTTHLENFLIFNSTNTQLREEMLVLKTGYDGQKELIKTYIEQKQLKYFDFLSDAVDMTSMLEIVDEDKLFSVQLRNNIMVISAYEVSLKEIYNRIASSQRKIVLLVDAEFKFNVEARQADPVLVD